MPRRSKKKRRGCLRGFIGFLLIIVIIYFGWQWFTGLGSANIEIALLEAKLKPDRDGVPQDSTILVELTLQNRGNQPGQFVLDRKNYDEARKMEDMKPGKVWSFMTELYFPEIDKWIEIDNADNWRGDKITPGALEITLDEESALSLNFHLKSKRRLRIRYPQNIPSELDQNSVPEQLQISIIAPNGEIASSSKISF